MSVRFITLFFLMVCFVVEKPCHAISFDAAMFLKRMTYGIVQNGSTRNWSDGTYATSCNGYLNPPVTAKRYKYQGATGDGTYRIKIGATAYDVNCDMTSDGGGWTQLNSTLSSSGNWSGSTLYATPVQANGCNAGNINFSVSGIIVPFTNLRMYLNRSTVTQCAGLTEYGSTAGLPNSGVSAYWNGSSWVSASSSCTWSNPWASTIGNNPSISGLPSYWKFFAGHPANGNGFSFITNCAYTNDNGQYNITFWVQ